MIKRKRNRQISIFRGKKCIICGAQATLLRVSTGEWHNLCDKTKCSNSSIRRLGL